ncbi:pyrroline-5-carboxylate reductase [Niameybacter massiliensis]|uniref:Pyrroline-5-carboxylate reductase n=1 Tax=Holtiella tumoricola TaxID=3018743 RepID=A0AA42DP72_9FIRM|nr:MULTISPECIES: pyrroline-5-carboxylate reductase [Lachnospirales]MDA3732578.1 pyrroline-5-carboxylate reductase [Holtiella tumoricola]
MKRFGFIGVGNMGGAMIGAITKYFEEKVALFDVDSNQYNKFDATRIIGCTSVEELVKQTDIIILSVKPQYYEIVCSQIKELLNEEQVIITVAPGVSINKMQTLLAGHKKIIRTMPNTPALVGEGVTAYCFEEGVISKEEIETIESRFNAFGRSFKIVENQMNAIVALSGSSPAYGYMFIEAMADAAVRFGVPRQMAYEMAALSIKGACEMVLETKEHPAVLKDAVTSPGGTTIEAVAKLEETGFRNSVISGMSACFDKANRMS